jgi:tRNA(adenine34) deaminase
MSDGGELDLELMGLALDEARGAALADEVPIGAAVVVDGRVIARAANRTRRDGDPTAHAEMVVLRAAAQEIGNHRLLGATMFVTLEPCAMCAGAMIQARIARVVYGADDPKGGAVRSCFEVLNHPRLNHQVQVTAGILAEESAALLREFFAVRRGAKRSDVTWDEGLQRP